jgi:hypothetical protein
MKTKPRTLFTNAHTTYIIKYFRTKGICNSEAEGLDTDCYSRGYAVDEALARHHLLRCLWY